MISQACSASRFCSAHFSTFLLCLDKCFDGFVSFVAITYFLTKDGLDDFHLLLLGDVDVGSDGGLVSLDSQRAQTSKVAAVFTAKPSGLPLIDTILDHVSDNSFESSKFFVEGWQGGCVVVFFRILFVSVYLLVKIVFYEIFIFQFSKLSRGRMRFFLGF